MIDPADEAAVEAQLGRAPRAIHEVGHRCPCGNPDVVTTEPRLPGGTPFPTTYYLTCPRAASRIGTLEGTGTMKQMQARLGEDPDLAAAYRAAHERYLAARAAIGEQAGLSVPEIEGISAGGMPDRVKCLHVLAGQSLAQGRGVNPLGDEVLDLLGEWWAEGPCVAGRSSDVETQPGRSSDVETQPGRSSDVETPGRSSEVETPGRSSDVETQPGRSSDVETPGRSSDVETPGRSSDVETPGRSSEVETPG